MGQDPQKRLVLKYGAVQTILARYLVTKDWVVETGYRSKPSVAVAKSERARRLVTIKSSVSKLFKSCTIRHIAMSVVMSYVHTDIFHKRPPQLSELTFQKVCT